MSDSYLALLDEMIADMKADATLTAIVGQRIYSDIPDNPTFPLALVNISSQPFDTKTTNGMEHTAQVSIFSRKTSPEEAADARAAVYNLFHKQEAALSAAGVSVIIFNGVAPVFKDPDGKTWQALIQFRVIIG